MDLIKTALLAVGIVLLAILGWIAFIFAIAAPFFLLMWLFIWAAMKLFA